ncbi:MAG TPA: hypothetical protein VFG09_08405 [Thermodesulfovibrionales bacterium]|nr:hypothetical protein [Thermodesulfovibrionales bacterium]
MMAIILLFLIAFLFKGYNLKRQGYQITGLSKKATRALTIVILILIVGLLFRVMGKIAVLIGVLIAIIYLMSLKKS